MKKYTALIFVVLAIALFTSCSVARSATTQRQFDFGCMTATNHSSVNVGVSMINSSVNLGGNQVDATTVGLATYGPPRSILLGLDMMVNYPEDGDAQIASANPRTNYPGPYNHQAFALASVNPITDKRVAKSLGLKIGA